jgi:hypothetical protein
MRRMVIPSGMEELTEYKTFVDKGIAGEAPSGYKRIQYHMLFDVKLRNKKEI